MNSHNYFSQTLIFETFYDELFSVRNSFVILLTQLVANLDIGPKDFMNLDIFFLLVFSFADYEKHLKLVVSDND